MAAKNPFRAAPDIRVLLPSPQPKAAANRQTTPSYRLGADSALVIAGGAAIRA
jgi:hypothetical protein